jgi:hypothetical protein
MSGVKTKPLEVFLSRTLAKTNTLKGETEMIAILYWALVFGFFVAFGAVMIAVTKPNVGPPFGPLELYGPLDGNETEK